MNSKCMQLILACQQRIYVHINVYRLKHLFNLANWKLFLPFVSLDLKNIFLVHNQWWNSTTLTIVVYKLHMIP